MTEFGYTAMGEQTPAKQMVTDVAAAEEAGFAFSVFSDHYFPWIEEQGHSPYTWSVLGAAAQATERIPLMTFVTCPTMRYHPAVVAQKAATMGVLSDGRFSLGVGAGENLNEHIVGRGWPDVGVRHEMLREALEIIRKLYTGDYVNYRGSHYRVDRAKLYDLPAVPPAIGVAVSGPASARIAAGYGDAMIAVQPEAGLVAEFERAAGSGKPKYGQLPISFDRDEDAAKERAWKLWRWGTPGWNVQAELPDPRAFAAASSGIRAEEVFEAVSCGGDTAKHVQAVKKYLDAGFTHVALVQVGADRQQEFISWAGKELLPALREL